METEQTNVIQGWKRPTQCEHEWMHVGAEINQQCRWCSKWRSWPNMTDIESLMDHFWELQHDHY